MAVVLPVVVLLAGAWLMTVITGRQAVVARLAAHAAPADRTPLNQRLRYRVADVERHWGALDESTRAIEAAGLKIDLLFPVAYGAALIVAMMLVRPERQGWLAWSWPMLLVALTALADWTENLMLLRQLGRVGVAAVAGRCHRGGDHGHHDEASGLWGQLRRGARAGGPRIPRSSVICLRSRLRPLLRRSP